MGGISHVIQEANVTLSTQDRGTSFKSAAFVYKCLSYPPQFLKADLFLNKVFYKISHLACFLKNTERDVQK